MNGHRRAVRAASRIWLPHRGIADTHEPAAFVIARRAFAQKARWANLVQSSSTCHAHVPPRVGEERFPPFAESSCALGDWLESELYMTYSTIVTIRAHLSHWLDEPATGAQRRPRDRAALAPHGVGSGIPLTDKPCASKADSSSLMASPRDAQRESTLCRRMGSCGRGHRLTPGRAPPYRPFAGRRVRLRKRSSSGVAVRRHTSRSRFRQAPGRAVQGAGSNCRYWNAAVHRHST